MRKAKIYIQNYIKVNKIIKKNHYFNVKGFFGRKRKCCKQVKWSVPGNEERKTGADLEVLNAAAGGSRQSVGNRRVAEQSQVGKMIRLKNT